MSKFISLSSKDRTSGNLNDFEIKFNSPIENVRRINSVQIVLPYSWYTVMTGVNDKIYFTSATVAYVATLTQGMYTVSALTTHVQTQINAAHTPDNNFTVALDNVTTKKFTISHASVAFTLTFATNTTASARGLLGYNETDTASATSHVADVRYNLTHDSTIFVKSFALSSTAAYVGNKKRAFVIPIVVNTNPGGSVLYEANGEFWPLQFSDSDGRSFNSIDLALYFEDGTTLVPIQTDWRINFQYFEKGL